MELDHVFFRPIEAEPVAERLEALGFTPTYRRTHTGQGTDNVCYAFENAFLEILRVTDPLMTQSAPVARLQLATRVNPFGLAWRPTSTDALGRSDVPTWACQPPYLPAGRAIDVATASDDPKLPLLFTFPGSHAPSTWPAERRGTLQATAGYTRLELETLWLPADVSASATLQAVMAALGGRIAVAPDGEYGLDLKLTRAHDAQPRRLRLPACALEF